MAKIKEIKDPDFTTKFGQKLKPIWDEHPILKTKWKEFKANHLGRWSDKEIIKSMVQEHDRISNITWKVMTLPYTVALQVKLVAILKSSK